MENPIVKVEHLYHRYTTTRWAIEDIDFEINGSGVVGLLGSNGAGKSTTMNIICGVLKQTQGKVYIDGIDTLKDPVAARKYIGFLPQKPPLYPDLTVDEYLRFCAEIHWMARKKINTAISLAEERCGITHVKNGCYVTCPGDTSSGWVLPKLFCMILNSWFLMSLRMDWIQTKFWKFVN